MARTEAESCCVSSSEGRSVYICTALAFQGDYGSRPIEAFEAWDIMGEVRFRRGKYAAHLKFANSTSKIKTSFSRRPGSAFE